MKMNLLILIVASTLGAIAPAQQADTFAEEDTPVAGKSRRIHSLQSNISAINGQPVPKGATHYYYDGDNVRYLGGRIGPTSTPTGPVYHDSIASFHLPEVGFPRNRATFAGSIAAGNRAFLELFDEPIGPLTLDGPTPLLPAHGELEKTVTEDRFSTVRAIFENATLPEQSDLSKNSVWVGRCVFLSSPHTETAGLLALAVEPPHVRPAIFTVATAMELVSDTTSARANRFEELGGGVVDEAKQRLADTGYERSLLSHRPLQGRSQDDASLYFDMRRKFSNGTERSGVRVRTFTGPTGKSVLVTETYSPFRDGAVFTGKRVEFMEPVQYCVFNKVFYW